MVLFHTKPLPLPTPRHTTSPPPTALPFPPPPRYNPPMPTTTSTPTPTPPTTTPLIALTHCSVRMGQGYALRDATWHLHPTQHWALLGGNGAGKTTLMRLARGEIHPAQGTPFGHPATRTWNFTNTPTTSALDARANIALISADDQDAWVRYDRPYTAEELVCTGILDTLALWGEPGPEVRAHARATLHRLGADDLTERVVLELSRGQARLVHIARALARSPRVLLLDEALEGLDTRMRARILDALAREAERGTQIVLTTHHLSECPPFLTHAAILADGAVRESGPAGEVLAAAHARAQARRKHPSAATAFATDADLAPAASDETATEEALSTGIDAAPAVPILRLENVTVVRGARAVLEGVDWTVRPDEHWAVLGHNGAGKSTLAALATAALRPTTGSIAWFGESEAVNVWDLRRRIGLVSPELQAGYRYNVTALEMTASGFYSSVGLYDRVTPIQAERAARCMALAGMAGYEDRPIRSLSYGQIRRLVIARALVTRPELLLLDEPTAGLDPAARDAFVADMDALGASGATLVVISHRPEEIPPCVGKAMFLENGRITAMGDKAEVLGRAWRDG